MLQLNNGRAAHPAVDAPRASSLLGTQDSSSEIHRVYNEIFDAVMDTRLLPGSKLTEATLCSICACSRATVRGALAQLAHDKIVNIVPHRGAFVWQPTLKETQDIFDLRRATECLVVERLLAMPKLRCHLEPLYDMVNHERTCFEAGDRVSWIRLSNAFHVELARRVGNHVLTELMHSLCSRTTLIIAYDDTPGQHTCSYLEHKEILDRLAVRDRDGAMQAMQHHLEGCEQRAHRSEMRRADPWAAVHIKPQPQISGQP
jgi:DNA-binding GntR family transcriptional regulator